MLRSPCAKSGSTIRSCRNRPNVEVLEDRRLLTADVSAVSAPLHVEVNVPEMAGIQANELGSQAAVQFENPATESDSLSSKRVDLGFTAGLSVPPDNSIGPLVECPGLEPEYCLPGDADLDYDVDFLDFLILSNNFGLTNATWGDGDFDGDAEVGFSDYVILANNYGMSVQLPPPSAAASSADASDSLIGDGDRANHHDWVNRVRALFVGNTESDTKAIRPVRATIHLDSGSPRR